MKPFKTVKIEYYEEFDINYNPARRIKVVTSTEEWAGSSKDPVVETHFEYL
jgi:hypothetical protein